MKSYFKWLGFGAIVIIIFGTMYAAVQNSQRNDANNPQIQIAQDTASRLNKGVKPEQLPAERINIRTSLSPFVIVYDRSGQPKYSNGDIDGRQPAIPLGVLKNSEGKDFHAVTWQPQNNIRIASVTVAATNYYVLSGRSLSQVESNEDETLKIAAFGCVVSLLILGTIYVLSRQKD